MGAFVLGAVVASVAVTGLLTWLLYRMNAAAHEEARRRASAEPIASADAADADD